MKTIFWIFIFYVGITTIYAQDADNQVLDGIDTVSISNEKDESTCILICELQPSFKGGIDSLKKYLSQNLHYPKTASKSGTVYVNFTIEKDGKITNVIILKGLEPVLDNEALRVIRMMPAWIPGKPDAVRYNLPIKFKQSN
jgi:TonB family protein